jgi:hypothetical protein
VSWINKEFERRHKEDAARRASLTEESTHREVILTGLPLAWKRLVDALVADLEAFNSQSEKKANPRVTGSQVDVLWLGKKGPLLTIQLDAEKFFIVYTYPSEAPKKLKIVLNDYSDPYLWGEQEGRMTFERASELLLKPVLFP